MAGEATVKLFDHTFSGNPNNPMFNFLQEMECYINSDAKKPAEMYKVRGDRYFFSLSCSHFSSHVAT